MTAATRFVTLPGDLEVGDHIELGSPDRSVTAALSPGSEGEHTGAMIALIPDNAVHIAIEGGESADELHTTMFYLGDAADIPPELQAAIVAEVRQRASTYEQITGTTFGVAIWNPEGDEPSLVWSVGGPELTPFRDDMRQAIINAPDNVDGERPDWSMPEQHVPWVPHICAAYADDVQSLIDAIPEALEHRMGLVPYSHVRVAFGPDVTDIPLGGE